MTEIIERNYLQKVTCTQCKNFTSDQVGTAIMAMEVLNGQNS